MSARTLVIAEAGVNHGGRLDLALSLVDAAAAAGADVVKFQTFDADLLVTADARKAPYQAEATGGDASQRDMLRALELDQAAHQALVGRCAERGIEFLSTGFDEASVDFLVGLGIRRIKVPSGECTNLPYLRHVGGLGLPVLLSTGMADLDEVTAAVAALESAGMPRSAVTVLHCTTAYPAPYDDVHLRAIGTLRDTLGTAVGYSDHTLGVEVAVAAVALGATVVEKHLTLDRSLPGPDHAASLEPAELATLVAMVRHVEQALGGIGKHAQPSELANRDVARRSLVARTAIRAGDTLTPANVAAKRPGTGLSPMRWDEVIGQPASRDYTADEMIDP